MWFIVALVEQFDFKRNPIEYSKNDRAIVPDRERGAVVAEMMAFPI